MTTNIQRQEATTAKILAIYMGPSHKMISARRSLVFKAHTAAMLALGYTENECYASLIECDDMALLQARELGVIFN